MVMSMGERVKGKYLDISTIWEELSAALLRGGIDAATAEVRVNWARSFLNGSPSVPLADRSAGDIDRFLASLLEVRRFDARYQQHAADALRVLYREVLMVPWAVAKDWSPATSGPGRPVAAAQAAPRQHNGMLPDAQREAIGRLRTEIRTRHYSPRTEQAYQQWAVRYLAFERGRAGDAPRVVLVREFLEELATVGKVAASTQNQALNALAFFFEKAVGAPLGAIGDFVRAKRPTRIPVVLSRDEVARLLAAIPGVYRLMAQLLYGSGLRLMECVTLRVRDLDFERQQLVIREGKGMKDRVTVLSRNLQRPLQEHLGRVRTLHDLDLSRGYGATVLSPGLARRQPDRKSVV